VLLVQRTGEVVGRFLLVLTRFLAQPGRVLPVLVALRDGLFTGRGRRLGLGLGHHVAIDECLFVAGLVGGREALEVAQLAVTVQHPVER